MPDTNRIFSADKVVLGICAAAALIVVSQYYVLSGEIGTLNMQFSGMRATQEIVAAQLATLSDKGSGTAQRTEAVLTQLLERQRQTEEKMNDTEKRMQAEHAALEGRVSHRIDRLEQEIRAPVRGGK